MNPEGVLRLVRGRLLPRDEPALLERLRTEVPPAAELGGSGTAAIGVRDLGDDIGLLAVSVWSDRAALAAVSGSGRPTMAFDPLAGIVSFSPPEEFDLLISETLSAPSAPHGAIGLVRVAVAPVDEPSVLDLIAGQALALRSDGLVRALLSGRREVDAVVELAAVAVWPDRDATAAFLANRPEGPGLDPRFLERAVSVSFEMYDIVDPAGAPPESGVPAVVVLDRDLTIVDASVGLERLVGIPAEAFVGQTLEHVVGEAARRSLAGRLAPLLVGRAVSGTISVHAGDGAEMTLAYHGAPNLPSRGLHALVLDRPGTAVTDPEAAVRRAFGDWGSGTEVRTERRAPLPRLVTMPSADRLFARFVELTVERFGHPSMRRLQLHLRGLYPHAVVHRRDLAGEPESWYVFRDGSARVEPVPDGWWDRPQAAKGSIHRQGRILSLAGGGVTLSGLRPRDLVGRDVRTLGVPGSFEDLALLLELTFIEAVTNSTLRVLSRSAEPVDLAFHTERDGDIVRFAVTRIDGDPVGADWLAPVCLPAWDEVFIARVEQLCARLALRHDADVAAELATRLRDSYPDVTVRALGRLTGFGPGTQVLLVHRDGEPEADDGWWASPEVARVRFEGDRYVDANDRALELYGVTRRTLLGTRRGMVGMGGDEAMVIRDVLNRTGIVHTTTQLQRGDGTSVAVEFRAVVVGHDPLTIEMALRENAHATRSQVEPEQLAATRMPR